MEIWRTGKWYFTKKPWCFLLQIKYLLLSICMLTIFLILLQLPLVLWNDASFNLSALTLLFSPHHSKRTASPLLHSALHNNNSFEPAMLIVALRRFHLGCVVNLISSAPGLLLRYTNSLTIIIVIIIISCRSILMVYFVFGT